MFDTGTTIPRTPLPSADAHQVEPFADAEEPFRLLVEGVRDYAIYMLDPAGYVVSWNAGAEAIKGYCADEIVGQHFSRFYTPEDVARGRPLQGLDRALADGRFEDEGWRLKKDGTRIWASVLITALYDKTGRHRGFAKVTRDMTDRKRIESLERSERELNEFLGMLAHELRNPMAPIRNAVSVMRLEELRHPGLKWCREVIVRQTTLMARLIDDLLDISRVTRGKLTLNKERVNLVNLISFGVAPVQAMIDRRGQTLTTLMPDAPVWVEADSARIEQAVQNVVHNASKFSGEGGHITVQLALDGGTAVVTVSDDGHGMPPATVNRVFDMFFQDDRGHDPSEPGLGVGLSLVRRVMELHHGSIHAASAGIGCGSTFTLRMPVSEAVELSDSRGASSNGQGSDAAEAGSDTQQAPGVPGSKRVLVVDDNRDSADSMAMFLELSGHVVRATYDGESALPAAAEFNPDIVLLDISMPGMSGYDVAERLRAMPRGRDMVLVAMTGYGQADDRRRTAAAGFDHHLVKPVDIAALEQEILAAHRV